MGVEEIIETTDDGLQIIIQPGLFGVRDLNANELGVPCKWTFLTYLGNNLFGVRNKDKLWGVLDKEGKEIIPFVFDWIEKEPSVVLEDTTRVGIGLLLKDKYRYGSAYKYIYNSYPIYRDMKEFPIRSYKE